MKRSSTAGALTVALGTAAILAAGAPAASAGTPAEAKTAADTVTTIKSGDGDTLRAIFYEDRGFDGDELWYWGSSACTASTLDADYSLGVMPSGWNDRISSVRDYNSCDVSLYRDGNFYGGATGYVNYGGGRDLGFTWNDQTSSFRVS